MADQAQQQYLNMQLSGDGGGDDDPFGRVAKMVSACPITRSDGGKIGWVDRIEDNSNNALSVLPSDVITKMYGLQPKSGDMHVIQSDETRQWHLIQIVELWIQNPITPLSASPSTATATQSSSSSSSDSTTTISPRLGSHMGSNDLIRRRSNRLEGQGNSATTDTNMNQLKTYHIQTAGCQMNVADSERLAGILEHSMQLRPAKSPDRADLVLFNTCSIRDHAESKLYSALGPLLRPKATGQAGDADRYGLRGAAGGAGVLIRRVPENRCRTGTAVRPVLTECRRKHRCCRTASIGGDVTHASARTATTG